MPGPRFTIASAMGSRQSTDDFDIIVSAMGSAAVTNGTPTPTPTPPALWTPAALGAALVGWWDAADASTLVFNGSSVASWSSKGATTLPATQATASRQPVYSATAFGGLPGVQFDGVDDRLPLLSFSAASGFSTGAADSVIIGVGSVSSTVGSYGRMFSYGSANANRDIGYNGADSNKPVFFEVNGGGMKNAAAGWLSTPHFVMLQTTGGNSHLFTTDANSSVPLARAVTTTATAAAIGSDFAGANFFQGITSEIIVTNAALSAADKPKMEGYLAWKWGLQANLPVNHPYKMGAPTL